MTQTKNKQIADYRVFLKRLNDLLISLMALALTIGTFVLIAATAALLSGCASPKYEVVRTDRWIVKDGWVVGEKGKPNAVKEGTTETPSNDPNTNKYGAIDRNKTDRFNRNRNKSNLNDSDRNSTLALYKGKPIEAIEEAWVRSVLPNTQIELIRRSPAANFYTAFLGNGQLIYVNPSQRLLFFGEIYTSGGENLTNISRGRFAEIKASQRALEVNATELEELGFGEISGDRFIAMVYSPLCPYCHRADEFLSINQIPVKRIFMVDLRNHNDEGVKRSIEYLTTASKEAREALLVKWRSREGYEAPISADGQINEQTQEAVARLTKMKEFIERNNIDGTPYIYLINRKSNKVEQVLSGFNASTTGEQIKTWFATNGDKQ
jgi:thiol:disulfide interchange protein DsbC